MNTKLSVASALFAGLLGGLLTRYIAPPVAFAQDQASITKELRAQSFTLVDSSDHAIGTFTAEPLSPPVVVNTFPPNPLQAPKYRPQMRIVLRDSNGREIWSAGGGPKIMPARAE